MKLQGCRKRLACGLHRRQPAQICFAKSKQQKKRARKGGLGWKAMASYDKISDGWYRVCPKRSSNRALITVKFPFSTLFRLKSMTDITPFANRLGK
ncbi:hypothetical protein AAC610_14915, partial [Neisseria gonorrhoeae]